MTTLPGQLGELLWLRRRCRPLLLLLMVASSLLLLLLSLAASLILLNGLHARRQQEKGRRSGDHSESLNGCRPPVRGNNGVQVQALKYYITSLLFGGQGGSHGEDKSAVVLFTCRHGCQSSQEICHYALYGSSSVHREPDFWRAPQ